MSINSNEHAEQLGVYMAYWNGSNPNATQEECNAKWKEAYADLVYGKSLFEMDAEYLQWCKEQFRVSMEDKTEQLDTNPAGKHSRGRATNRTPKKRRRK